jgi:hypothetical protein
MKVICVKFTRCLCIVEALIDFPQQIWVKTAEGLARDRLLGSFSVS